MNDLDTYRPDQYHQEIMAYDEPFSAESDSFSSGSGSGLSRAILRRWRIVLLCFVLVSAAGVPPIWLLMKSQFYYEGAIRVAPILMHPLSGEKDTGEISNYRMFANTQAKLIKSNPILQAVTAELRDKNLPFFADEPDPVAALRRAIMEERIRVATASGTELITIVMRDQEGAQGELVVNAFIRAYMAREGSRSKDVGGQNLALLEEKARELENKLRNHRKMIRQLAEEYGTDEMTGWQKGMLDQVMYLQSALTRTYAERIKLETQLEFLEQNSESQIMPEDIADRRKKYVNADETMQSFNRTIRQIEQALLVARQTMAETNPELHRKEELLASFRESAEARRKIVEQQFEELMNVELTRSGVRRLEAKKMQLKELQAYEERVDAMLKQRDTETRKLGQKQLAIQDIQEQRDTDKEYYERVQHRIRDLEMDRKRPARIRIEYLASAIPVSDKKMQYTVAVILGALALGVFLGIARDKMDHSLHTPEDVVRCISIPIIGTTTSSNQLDRGMPGRHVEDDYQAIRANLGLVSGEGIPARLVVTSAGMREGKTTFAVNLAISMGKAGSKVLLIDGDFRKPDVARLLGLNRNIDGLQQVLFGTNDFEQMVCSTSLDQLDVLATTAEHVSQTFEALAQPRTCEIIEQISRRYDHVIIDTPPVLAAADALLWAKLADATVLTSFAGGTVASELKAAMDRLSRIEVRVLGAILHSVSVNQSYHRYGYGYYGSDNGRRRKSRRDRNRPLLIPAQSDDNNGDQA